MRRPSKPDFPASGESQRLDRRTLLRLCVGGVGIQALGGLPASALGRVLRQGGEAGPGGAGEALGTLVLLQCSGGHDGLSCVVPFADDDYHRLRPTLALGADEVLRLDERRGLHPNLGRLRARFDAGGLAIVEGVGTPLPNRSHFKSLDVWHTADPRGRRAGSGWVGRLAEAAFPADEPLSVVHVGSDVPYSLASELRPPTAFLSAHAFRRLVPDGVETVGEPPAEEPPREGEPEVLAHLRRVAHQAEVSSARLAAALERHEPRAEYPGGPLAEGLRTAAALIEARIGVRVVSVEHGGFDTHNDQRRRHDRLMEELDAALDAFLADVAHSEAGRATVVCAFSEFGRRVAENGSRGTDHGTAGPVLVAGARVRGGFHGSTPSLARLEDGDPVATTDFRAVYAGLIEGVFGLPGERVLGERFRPVAFL